jgi:hypothetical protein
VADKQPNDRLVSAFKASQWSKGEVARQVNKRARLLGTCQVSTDTSRVRRWLDGERPRDPIPRILSDLFSERFGRVVTAAELGLSEPRTPFDASGVELPWDGSRTVEALGEFSRSDLMLDRRGFLGVSMAFSTGAALVEPVRAWGDTPPSISAPPASAVTPVGRIGRAELEALEATTRKFREWDATYGGGLRRKAVVGQLNEVTTLLQENHPDRTRRRLFRIASELSLLAGWMSYDIGIQPAAQRYYVLALHAAKESGDEPLGANVLTTMSRQMIHLGRPEDALDLLRFAHDGSRDTATASTQAVIHALRGRAYATLGDAQECQRAIGTAEDVFTHRTPASDPDWIKYFSPAELAAENGHSYRDLAYRDHRFARRAEPLMGQAVEGFTGTYYVRSRTLNLIGLASTHLLRGEPEQACQVADHAVALAKEVRSARVTHRLRETVTAAQREHPSLPCVRDLHEKVTTTFGTDRT